MRSANPAAATTAGLLRTYFAAQPPEQRRMLKQIRSIARTVAPGAEDAWSYRIPALRYHGIRRTFAAELKGYRTAKGTIQFPVGKRIPVALVKRLIKARMAEMR
jgi:uncharacterized protein YdhG (YjbR/CyaY superfamily)